jgi:uncharacterized membrane protein HdeD (DUF308 family)
MLERISANWWLLALRGIVGILFGVVAFLLPGATYFVLVAFFAAYMFVAGIFALISAFHFNERGGPLALLILEGVAGIAIGVVTFFWPGLTAIALLYTIGAWSIFAGILQLALAFRVRQELPDEILLVLAGIASIVFGVLIAVAPLLGLLLYMWILGVYAVVFGILLLVLAVRVRGLGTSSAAKTTVGGSAV